jgi:hypothetical protein
VAPVGEPGDHMQSILIGASPESTHIRAWLVHHPGNLQPIGLKPSNLMS